MSLYYIILFLFVLDSTQTENYESIETNHLGESEYSVKLFDNDFYLTQFKLFTSYKEKVEEKVEIQIYYECLCPDCIEFDVENFSPVLETMNQYLDIHTYPYGNARTIQKKGKIKFICQHGSAECYGNKLHACALDNLQHITALRYNICLMNSTEGRGSDDEMADKCGQAMGCDSEAIKACAKNSRGTELLRYYGEQSKMANFKYVPYVLINGKEYHTDGNEDFKEALCAAFVNPPPPCAN